MKGEPFRTNNQQLAFALMTAGCRLWPQSAEQDEESGPATNEYSLGFLRDRKIGTGMGMEDAVKFCIDKRIPGNVNYLFVRDEMLEKCQAAWDGLVKEFQEADHLRRAPNVPAIDSETVMRILFVHANNKASFSELPWYNSPLLSTIDKSSKFEEIPGKPAPRELVSGKGRLWSLNLNSADKAKLFAT